MNEESNLIQSELIVIGCYSMSHGNNFFEIIFDESFNFPCDFVVGIFGNIRVGDAEGRAGKLA